MSLVSRFEKPANGDLLLSAALILQLILIKEIDKDRVKRVLVLICVFIRTNLNLNFC